MYYFNELFSLILGEDGKPIGEPLVLEIELFEDEYNEVKEAFNELIENNILYEAAYVDRNVDIAFGNHKVVTIKISKKDGSRSRLGTDAQHGPRIKILYPKALNKLEVTIPSKDQIAKGDKDPKIIGDYERSFNAYVDTAVEFVNKNRYNLYNIETTDKDRASYNSFKKMISRNKNMILQKVADDDELYFYYLSNRGITEDKDNANNKSKND